MQVQSVFCVGYSCVQLPIYLLSVSIPFFREGALSLLVKPKWRRWGIFCCPDRWNKSVRLCILHLRQWYCRVFSFDLICTSATFVVLLVVKRFCFPVFSALLFILAIKTVAFEYEIKMLANLRHINKIMKFFHIFLFWLIIKFYQFCLLYIRGIFAA